MKQRIESEWVEYRQVPRLPFLRVSREGVVQTRLNKQKRPLPEGEWRNLKPQPRESGHTRVPTTVNGRFRYEYVHSLVLEAFVGPCPEGMEACHGDGNPANNRVENLRWDTHTGNMVDCTRHGRTQRGTKCHAAKTDEAGVAEVFRLRGEGLTLKAIGDQVGLSYSQIGYILRGERWKHLVREG